MTIDLAAISAAASAAQQAAHASQGTAFGAGAPGAAAGYNVSLTDLSGFQQALARASTRLEGRPLTQPSQGVQQLFRPFEHINGEASQLASEARAAKAEGREMTPSEVVMLTVRSTEFMFHCQLTSNIANRTSDGLQQLFRQQS